MGFFVAMVAKPEPIAKLLSSWPIPRLPNWTRRVNEALNDKELNAVRRCAHRGQPYGNDEWAESEARRMNLESTMRPRGRPKKSIDQAKSNKET